MSFSIRWLKRRYQHALISPKRRELEQRLSNDWEKPIRLVPASTSESYDEIFYAIHNDARVAVVRVNSPHRGPKDPVKPEDPIYPLDSAGRLEREWTAYSKLSAVDLSPQPLWRSDDAIACSWFDWERVSRYLVQHRSRFWDVFEKLLPAIRLMHEQGVTHLDMNLGNFLISRDGKKIVIIDFEFDPNDWLTYEQQLGFDYLRVILDCTKRRRGGQYLLSDLDRMVATIEKNVEPAAREADLSFAPRQLHRLKKYPELQARLSKLFHGI
ncbi:phosphotransferase [Thalassoglobus polymorphus]|uniref:Aminoglycoside phosphotransferase domain-containing protein n=1 Tax=Thalassoglobus polymorphus TaxID=2527994 RepID=A0A517QIH0_9PLAN|nr:phosphotransferase [Thalassoglobus polymorphus]QDT31367.1 hypothetical protein Mal48_06000 [Thalassoglobus polymorphus]